MYIQALTFTEAGMQHVMHMSQFIGKATKVIEGQKGRLLQSYATLGSFDIFLIIEAPDNAAAVRIGALIDALGVARTQTLPAIPVEQMVQKGEIG